MKIVDDLPESSELLKQAYKDHLQPIAGVRELIARLRVPFCVASNSPPAKLGGHPRRPIGATRLGVDSVDLGDQRGPSLLGD